MNRSILISIKPEFVDLIFSGQKTVELRRVVPKNVSTETEIIIYASSPTQCIVGKATIKRVEAHPVELLWSKIGDRTGITFAHFLDYFDGKEMGYGLVLDKIERFTTPYPLTSLREKLDFYPPQSYMYTSPELLELIN